MQIYNFKLKLIFHGPHGSQKSILFLFVEGKRQFGFKPGLNCELAVLDFVKGIKRDVSEKRIVLVAFEDFSVALNCLAH